MESRKYLSVCNGIESRILYRLRTSNRTYPMKYSVRPVRYWFPATCAKGDQFSNSILIRVSVLILRSSTIPSIRALPTIIGVRVLVIVLESVGAILTITTIEKRQEIQDSDSW
jgi:hypothetical protein